MDVNKTNFEPENEVISKGGFRDESSHLYVINIGKYLFLFPEEEFDKLSSIDRKTIWDTIDFVLANHITNTTKDTEDELAFDMYELITLSHSIVLPPITLKVDISLDRDVNGEEYDTLYNDVPYHLSTLVMEKSGEYRIYIHKAIYGSLSEEQTDKITDNLGYIAYSGCDKHEWFIDTECDLINFFNIIIFDVKPNYGRNTVVKEVELRDGFRDPQTGEYVLNPFPYVFVLPEWFENLEDSCRDNIYDICNQIATDPNQPKSNSTGNFAYKWDDIMACMGKYSSFTQRKQYNGPGAMEQLMERFMEREIDYNKYYTVDSSNEGWFAFESNFVISGLKVNVKGEVWDKLQPTELSSFMEAFEHMVMAHKEAKIYRQFCWNLTTTDSVYYFTKYATEDPLHLGFRVVIDNDVLRAYDSYDKAIRSAVFDFTTCTTDSLYFIVGTDFRCMNGSVISEIDRISMLTKEERILEFGMDFTMFYYNCGMFTPHKPEQIILELEMTDTMIGGFNGTTFYVTDNDEIVKENMYEDEVRGERCKILKFTAKRNGIYFYSIEMTAWNALDAVVEDMLITKARIVSKIGCSAHIWHFNSVGAVEEFLNIPVVDEKNLLGLNKPNPIKEENTMFNKFPLKKKNNDNLPKKEANPTMFNKFPLKKKNNDNLPKKEANPTMPTPEHAKVILDAMYACQADTTRYAEDMRRDRARANTVMARAVLTHGILTGDQMASRNFKLPKDIKYPYAIVPDASTLRMADDELVVVTNEKPATEQVLDTTNSVPVTNLQDYANILSTFVLLNETHEGLTAEEAASVVTNYIACRDQSLLEMLQETNSLEKVIGEGTVREIENTEYSNLMITSPTVMKYITILPVDEDDKK